MPDHLTAQQRSHTMSRIRSTGTKPEELLAALLREVFPRHWIRRHVDLPGKPDFYLPGLRLAVFMDGCFWHQYPKHGRLPDTNQDYWTPKLDRNGRRDRKANGALNAQGIKVRRIWEHDLVGSMTGARRKLARAAREFV